MRAFLRLVAVGVDHHALGAGMAQEAMGFGAFSCSTRHIRQLPAIARRGWKQKCGTSTPAS